MCVKGLVYRVCHDCHFDFDRDVSTAHYRSVHQAIVSIYWVGLFLPPWLFVGFDPKHCWIECYLRFDDSLANVALEMSCHNRWLLCSYNMCINRWLKERPEERVLWGRDACENDLYMALKKLPTSVRKNRFVVLLDMFLGGIKACDYFTPTWCLASPSSFKSSLLSYIFLEAWWM